MKQNAQSYSRRSALKVVTKGASAVLAGALPKVAIAQTSPAVDRAIAWAKTALPASTPELISGAAREGKLVLTLQQFGEDEITQGLITKFRERYPFINVEYTLQISAQIMKKFSAELSAKRGISDYVMLPSSLKETSVYIASGALSEFVISEDSAFPQYAKQKGIWYSWLRQHSVTMYRKGAINDQEKQLVRTYKGLADPRFKGRLGINNVTTSVTSAGCFALIKTQPETWAGLAANKPVVKLSSPTLVEGLLSGEYDVALMSGFPTAASAAKTGAPVEFLITSPSPVLYAPGAVSALAPNPNAARLWQDWSMSKEGMDLWTSLSGSIPSRSGIVTSWSQQQPWFFDDASNRVEIDWAEFSEKERDIVNRFKTDLQTR